MASTRLVVLATGDLAIPVVKAVVDGGHEVLRVVSQPAQRDEEAFLPEERQGSALANWARAHDLELRRRRRPGSEGVVRELEEMAPELGLIVAYGRSFPTSLLGVPRRGWIKVHFSLLPKYRGLHPVRASLWHGEKQTGATVIQVTEEPDAGPILEQDKLTIDSDETFGDLAPRVAALGADLVLAAVAKACRAKPKTKKQNEKVASTTPRFGRRHLLAPWWREAGVVHNRLRSLSPEPGMTTLVQGQRVRILKGALATHVQTHTGEAGSFIGLRSGSIAVLCGGGTVFSIDRVKPENGRSMSASSFVRARKLQAGRVFV